MFTITYFNRNLGRAVKAEYLTLDEARRAANSIFVETGIIVGIDRE